MKIYTDINTKKYIDFLYNAITNMKISNIKQ